METQSFHLENKKTPGQKDRTMSHGEKRLPTEDLSEFLRLVFGKGEDNRAIELTPAQRAEFSNKIELTLQFIDECDLIMRLKEAANQPIVLPPDPVQTTSKRRKRKKKHW